MGRSFGLTKPGTASRCASAAASAGTSAAASGSRWSLLAPVIAIGMRKEMAGRLQLSRTIAFQSLSLVAVGLYVVVLTAAAVLIEMIAGPYARVVEIGAVFFVAVTALVLLPSPQMRALWKVQVAKHFFQHRYDYRTEWMRFGETIGRPGEAPAPLGQRVAKAVADSALTALREREGSSTRHVEQSGTARAAPRKGPTV